MALADGDKVEYDGSFHRTAGDATSERRRVSRSAGAAVGQRSSLLSSSSLYGMAVTVESKGHFPAVGSTLGPYFCLGQLGKGTFSSIHKCIDMRYPDPREVEQPPKQQSIRRRRYQESRLAAAKVELSTFSQSGVLEAEATILDYLHHVAPGSVPAYLGHYKASLPSSSSSSLSLSSTTNKTTTAVASAQQQQQQQPAVAAALVMEFLGPDLHHLREQVMLAAATDKSNTPSSITSSSTRRLLTRDAVYLTARVMLPLLQQLHDVGVVHRDVKPSNCVQKRPGTVVLRPSPHHCSNHGDPPDDRDQNHDEESNNAHCYFCLVDFGLSKSIIVPHDSPYADLEHPWTGPHWLQPPNYHAATATSTITATLSNQNDAAPAAAAAAATTTPVTTGPCFRKEREQAEFRGTSMYASVRVHQLRDYCPRDDLYSLLYVFCDLVSGGLPWMSHAANRDRKRCQELKEMVHGERRVEEEEAGASPTTDKTEWLLMGDEYHVNKFRKERQDQAIQEHQAALQQQQQENGGALPPSPVNFGRPIQVPEPLAMSKDPRRVELLRKAFHHLSQLQFWDRPDYQLIQDCLLGFLDYCEEDDQASGIRPIQYPDPIASLSEKAKSVNKRSSRNHRNSSSSLVGAGKFMPKWTLSRGTTVTDEDLEDDIDESVFQDIDESSEANVDVKAQQQDEWFRLPMELRFRIRQLDYNAVRPDSVPLPQALDDWMKVVLPLLYGDWDATIYEPEGALRTSTDGLQRPIFLKLLTKCEAYAKQFQNFQSSDCYFRLEKATNNEDGTSSSNKRRKTNLVDVDSLVSVSRALYGLHRAKQVESSKRPPPTAGISFG